MVFEDPERSCFVVRRVKEEKAIAINVYLVFLVLSVPDSSTVDLALGHMESDLRLNPDSIS